MEELGGPRGQTDFRTNSCDGDNSSAVKGGFGCLSLPLLPRCPMHSYLQLQRVFSRSNMGKGWGQENQKPSTQICHRLRSKAQLSERVRHPEEQRRVHHKRAALGPYSLPRLACLPARPRAPSSQSLPTSPGSAKGSARLPRVPPLSHPSRRPRTQKVTPEVPGRAGVGGAGAGAGVRPDSGLLSPAPSRAPTGSSHCRSLSLSLPRSLKSPAPSGLPGRAPGWYLTGGLLVRCAAGVKGIKEKGKDTNFKN